MVKQKAMQELKYETASEIGVRIGANTPSRLNGAVGGEMVRRMVRLSQKALTKHGGEQG